MLLATGEHNFVYPLVIMTVEGVTCLALLDTGAGCSYISNRLEGVSKKKPVKEESRQT